ncbi:MAG: hypothetical protein HGB12_01460 [Bacteroidetes bacterium]|nr:hypothetical protein [Bacteroidota bacterium]
MKTKRTFLRNIMCIFLVFHCSLFTIHCFGQGIAINTTGDSAVNSAIIDISSTTQGALMPRMTSAQRDVISSPAQGLMIYNITTKCFEFYESGGWYNMGCTCTPPNVSVAIGGSGATTTQITTNWNTASGATHYHLDVSSSSSFANFVTDFSNKDVGNVTTYNVTGLSFFTTYYYRVRAENACGSSGNSSTITYATTNIWICGTSQLTDSRDSKTYNTVQIGTQCWMAQNLNYSASGTYIIGSTEQANNSSIEKYCYNNYEANCTTYGGLYQWGEMMDWTASSVANPSGVQGICPTDWHIPSDLEWTSLTTFLGGESVAGGKLKEAGFAHWQSPNAGATNEVGFTALPGGYRESDGTFNTIGGNGYWWSSTESSTTIAWYRDMNNSFNSVYRNTNNKILGFSVRCIKN